MKQDTHTSSPGRLVPLGEIVGTHGVRGLLRFHPYDRSSDLPPTGRSVYLTATRTAPHGPSTSRSIILDDARPHGSIALLSVRGIDSIEAAEALVGHTLALPEDELPAPDTNEYYVYQLEGLAVVTETGEPLGTVERSHSSPKIPTSASHGTLAAPACARAVSSASCTVACSASVTRHSHCVDSVA